MRQAIKIILPVLFILLISWPSFFCADGPAESSQAQTSLWKNVYDTSVHYVGMSVCRNCHNDIYESFIQTGMGQSFAPATPQKSAAVFNKHAIVYDKDLDFYYYPYWENDSLFILEYRVKGKDTIHKRVQHIQYIIGSGQHTNSHIFSVQGYLYQAPITFYTQKGQWDLAPGFEQGANSRFTRLIESECMTCHNAYPQPVAGSPNKFLSIPSGIDCERCHGPGSLHVAEKLAGHIVDTSQQPDYTIVNPRRLSIDLQNNLCQRCHLQGITVLQEGKTFYDFRPGMHLSEVMHVFMPQYQHADDKMIMASHVERMKKSACYLQSQQLSCITCHNPHISVKFTPRAQFINTCKSCHNQPNHTLCTESNTAIQAANGDCISCHMPQNSSIDIPHVAVTDHFIRRKPEQLKPTNKKPEPIFRGLVCYNEENPDPLIRARAYMDFFERLHPDVTLLDSAAYYLSKVASHPSSDYVRLYFLQQNYIELLSLASQLNPATTIDAWTAYRIGEAYMKSAQPEQALKWHSKAIELMPYSLDFQNKFAATLYSLGETQAALAQYHKIIQENPDYLPAQVSLGYLYLELGESQKAYQHMKKAQALSPDAEQNLINLAIWYHMHQADHEARKVLQHLIEKIPHHPQATAMLEDLNN